MVESRGEVYCVCVEFQIYSVLSLFKRLFGNLNFVLCQLNQILCF